MSIDGPRVVVTGIGMVTPFGCGTARSWPAIVRGESATRWLQPEELWPPDILQLATEQPAAAGSPPQLPEGLQPFAAAPAPHDQLEHVLGQLPGVPFRQDPAAGEPVVRLAVAAAAEALQHAGLSLLPESRPFSDERIACIIGTSKGGLTSFARACTADRLQPRHSPESNSSSTHTSTDIDPAAAAWWSFLPNAAAATVATRFGLAGPGVCPVAACATGLVSLIRGFSLIQSGEADVAVCGSADASVQLPVLASFRRLGVLARGFDNPASACRPFDESRNGFVVGEGAGILVLESEQHARARGARVLGRMLAGQGGADLSGITSVETEPAGLIHLLNAVCSSAGMDPARLGTISLHGTATLANDLAESRAVREVCGAATAGIPCTSLKGGMGHLLGAAGSVETAALILGLRDGIVPPTVNLRRPGAGCDLTMATGTAVRRELACGLKLSLGFGGQLAAALFSRD